MGVAAVTNLASALFPSGLSFDTSNGQREWTTVGVSENIIEASWEALVDGYLYGLLHPRDDDEAPSPPAVP